MADTFTIVPAHTAVLSMDCQDAIVSIYTRERKDAFLGPVLGRVQGTKRVFFLPARVVHARPESLLNKWRG